MSDIQLFNVGDNDDEIRFGITEDGTPYAVASDFAKALGYKQTKNALDGLDAEEVGFAETEINLADGRVQKRQVKVIYEDGLWELIFRSTLSGAKAIKKQVKAILREIRETGGFQVKPLTPGEMLVAQAQRFLENERRVAAIESEQVVLKAKMAGIEGEYDWFTCLAYAKLHGHGTNRPYLSKVGRYATALMRETGSEPHKRQDATFGLINVYPLDVLGQAFADVRE